MNKTEVLNNLMDVRHRKALLATEIELLSEKETFLDQEYKLIAGVSTATTDKKTKSTAAPAKKASQSLDLDEDEDTTTDNTEETDFDLDEEPKQKTAKAKPAATKKSAKQTEELEDVSDDSDDIDAALGTKPGKTETAPTIGDDEVRKLLSTIVREKGEAGKAKARVIMAKATRNNTAQVKDLLKGAHAKVYAALKKI